jgi:hypothetical protein
VEEGKEDGDNAGEAQPETKMRRGAGVRFNASRSTTVADVKS